MYRMIESAKELSRGIFWDIEGELLAFPFYEGILEGISKSGNTFNHKKLWKTVNPGRSSIPYNYYPRGRVEITRKGEPIIYLNPNIPDNLIPKIKSEFGIRETPKIVYDNSDHYKCHLDDGWRPDK